MPPPPDVIRLHVLIEGETRFFPVEIQNNKTVHDLKKVIVGEALLPVAAYTLDILQVNIDLEPYRGHRDLLRRLKADELSVLKLYTYDTIAQCWPGQPSLSSLHVIVHSESEDAQKESSKRPRETDADSEDLSDLQERQTKRYCRGATPSTVCRDSKEMEKQQNSAEILNGRPWTTSGSPVALYHPVFDTFYEDLKNPSPHYRTAMSADDEAGDYVSLPSIDDAFSFLRASSKYYAVEQIGKTDDERLFGRKEAILPILSRLLGVPLKQVRNSDLTEPGYLAHAYAFEGREGVTTIVEIKVESGIDGDAVTQTQQSYARTWSLPEYDDIRSISCCPSFLVAIAGPWITVFGAVYVQKAVVQHLAGPMYLSPQCLHPSETIESPLRLLSALRRGIETLGKYYQGLSATRTPTVSRFFPHIRSFQLPTGGAKALDYIQLLSNESRAVYLAKLDDGTQVVVKFASTYNARAHTVLANLNLAPKLLYDGTQGHRYGGLVMIIMQYIEGETLEEHLVNSGGSHGQLVDPASVIKSVTKAIKCLHSEHIVFGDLRTPNIHVGKDGNIRLLDFDWCGVHGVDKYPFIIGNGIDWARGVGPMATMNKDHDLFLLAKLDSHLQAGHIPGTW